MTKYVIFLAEMFMFSFSRFFFSFHIFILLPCVKTERIKRADDINRTHIET